jgi:hypothetical protein
MGWGGRAILLLAVFFFTSCFILQPCLGATLNLAIEDKRSDPSLKDVYVTVYGPICINTEGVSIPGTVEIYAEQSGVVGVEWTKNMGLCGHSFSVRVNGRDMVYFNNPGVVPPLYAGTHVNAGDRIQIYLRNNPNCCSCIDGMHDDNKGRTAWSGDAPYCSCPAEVPAAVEGQECKKCTGTGQYEPDPSKDGSACRFQQKVNTGWFKSEMVWSDGECYNGECKAGDCYDKAETTATKSMVVPGKLSDAIKELVTLKDEVIKETHLEEFKECTYPASFLCPPKSGLDCKKVRLDPIIKTSYKPVGAEETQCTESTSGSFVMDSGWQPLGKDIATMLLKDAVSKTEERAATLVCNEGCGKKMEMNIRNIDQSIGVLLNKAAATVDYTISCTGSNSKTNKYEASVYLYDVKYCEGK